MSDATVLTVHVAAAAGCGLIAGLFFAFSVAVMAALGRRPAAEGMAAMQAINTAILNPIFLTVFFGTAALCVAELIVSYASWPQAGTGYFAIAAALYLIGAIVVTMVINVPMNNTLARATTSAPGAEQLWAWYLARWTAWNHVRTVSTLAAAIAFALGFAVTP